MNLRIPDAPAMVAFLHEIASTQGSPVLDVEGWRVVEVGGRLLYHATDRAEVGGPYATLGQLLRDAGRLRHAEWSGGEPQMLLWDVREWGGAFFVVRSEVPEDPTRCGSLEEALGAGGRSARG